MRTPKQNFKLSRVILNFICVGLLCPTDAFSELQRNPFENKLEKKVEIVKTTPVPKKKVVTKNKIAPKEKKIPPKKNPPRITSIIVAGNASLIKVGDKHFRIGETIDDFTLTKVYASGAIFVKDGKNVDVKLLDNLKK